MASPRKLRYHRNYAVGEAATIGYGGRFAMTLPERSAKARRRCGWRYAAAAVLFLLGVTPAFPAAAEDPDPFTATVSVDANAENVLKAREMARTDGQRRAL